MMPCKTGDSHERKISPTTSCKAIKQSGHAQVPALWALKRNGDKAEDHRE